MNVPRNIHGILLLNKSKGFSSNQALQKVKRLFQAKKAGHTGSLDPLATGMLPICFGEATKFSHFLLDADKVYETTAKLGVATNTGDMEGTVIQTQKVPELFVEPVFQILKQFIGTIEQIPPMYSALKYQGQSLYKFARQGIEIERKARLVTIYDIKLLHINNDTVSLEIHCSKGTYIRTLVEDIAKALGTVGHVQSLHRRWVAPFHQQTYYQLDYLNSMHSTEEQDKLLLPIDFAVKQLPVIILNSNDVEKLQYGQSLTLFEGKEETIVSLYSQDKTFLGVGEIRENTLYPKRLVNLNLSS